MSSFISRKKAQASCEASNTEINTAMGKTVVQELDSCEDDICPRCAIGYHDREMGDWISWRMGKCGCIWFLKEWAIPKHHHSAAVNAFQGNSMACHDDSFLLSHWPNLCYCGSSQRVRETFTSFPSVFPIHVFLSGKNKKHQAFQRRLSCFEITFLQVSQLILRSYCHNGSVSLQQKKLFHATFCNFS